MTRLLTYVLVAICMAACTSTQVSVKTSPRPSPSIEASTLPTISPPGTPLSLATIQRLNDTTGFIAAWSGSGPVLARTTDNGATWQTINVPAAHVTSLRFIDSNIGWAGGLIPRDVPGGVACEQAPPSASSPCYGVVLRTLDGGATWAKSLLIPYGGVYPEPVLQIQAIDGQVAWALVLACSQATQPQGLLGCPTEIRHTLDGGRTWSTEIAGYIAQIRFATPSHGWLAAINPDGSSDIKTTLDGGVTWTTHLRTMSGSVVGLDAADSSNAWVMTQAGGYCSATTCERYELLRTTDGGNSWSSRGNPKSSAGGNCWGGHLVGPLFASPTRGWLAENLGAGGARATTGLLTTDDGGVTWRCLAQPSNTYLVSAADPMHLWITSNRLGDDATTLLSTDDGEISWKQLNLGGLGGAAPVHQ